MIELRCEACGSSQLNRRGSVMVCSFCGSRYVLDENLNIRSKALTDAKLLLCYVEAEKHRQAERYLDEFQMLTKALEIDDNNPETLTKLGRCCRALGQNGKALEYYNQAIEIDPACGSAYANIGTVYILTERYAEATAIYEKGLPHMNPSDSDYWTAFANYTLVIGKLGDLARAEAMIREAEEHGYPNCAALRRLLGLS